ncbi:MAG: prolipoprotein diacylglyceryl transferase [Bdellovibrionota bacterium]
MIWDVEPEIIKFGPLAIRWYSLSFMIGFLIAYQYMLRIFARNNWGKDTPDIVSSLFTHAFLGTLLGARLGHCFFYEPLEYLTHPWRVFMVWEGGLASHGGFIGVALSLFIFTRKHGGLSFFWLADRVAAPAMLTGALIRIGNFFNSEIIGKPADVPWAIVFKRVDMIPRHPSMLYESAAYFLISFLAFFAVEKYRKKWQEGSFLGLVLALGMSARFFIEFFKENQVRFEQDLVLNMGQMLSIPFIMMGLYLLTGRQTRNPALKVFTWAPPRKKSEELKQEKQRPGASKKKKKNK